MEKSIKIVFLGDNEVGKTTIVSQYIGEPLEKLSNRKGLVDLYMCSTSMYGVTFRISFWLYSNKEIGLKMISKADAIFIFFDLTSYESFVGLTEWIDIAKQSAKHGAIIKILATKKDLKRSEFIFSDEIKKNTAPCKCIEVGKDDKKLIKDVINETIEEIYGTQMQLVSSSSSRVCCTLS